MSATSVNFRLGLKVAAVLGLVAAAAALLIVMMRPVATVEPVVPGDALDAKPGSVTVVEAYAQKLTTETGGRVLRRNFNIDPGKPVKQGDVLAELDPADTLLLLKQKQIDFAAMKATYEADHSKELALDSKRADLANSERLNRLGLYSDKDLADRRRELMVLEQDLQMERITRKKTLDTLANDLAIEQRKLDKMIIRSPLDGVVSEVYAHPGDLVALDQPVATLISSQRVVEGKISEEDFAQIRVGEQANVTFLPYGDTEFPATVSKILPTADAETQRHLVHLDVTMDAAHPLVPGINGEVIITVGRRPAKAIVPRRAVFDLDGRSVFVVKDGTVALRRVTVGYQWSRGAEILAGLEPGESVIVDELERFNPGDRVRVQEAPSEVAR